MGIYVFFITVNKANIIQGQSCTKGSVFSSTVIRFTVDDADADDNPELFFGATRKSKRVGETSVWSWCLDI